MKVPGRGEIFVANFVPQKDNETPCSFPIFLHRNGEKNFIFSSTNLAITNAEGFHVSTEISGTE
jgi:hypothetical protein